MDASRRWTALSAAGLLLAWVGFREWAALLGGAAAVLGTALSYRARPRGWPSLRAALGDLALLNAAAALAGAIALWPLSPFLFRSLDDSERALWGHWFLGVALGGPSFLLGAALRMSL